MSSTLTRRSFLKAAAAAPLAPAWALFLAAFAANKVQGFALMKAAGIVNWPPVIAWFVSADLRRLFGICPTYWPVEVYWELAAGRSPLVPLAAGTLYLQGVTLENVDEMLAILGPLAGPVAVAAHATGSH